MHHSSPRRDPLSSDRLFRVDSGDPQEEPSLSRVEDDTSWDGIPSVFGHEIRVRRGKTVATQNPPPRNEPASRSRGSRATVRVGPVSVRSWESIGPPFDPRRCDAALLLRWSSRVGEDRHVASAASKSDRRVHRV